MMVEPVHVTVRPSPFQSCIDHFPCAFGETLADILADSGLPMERRRYARVAINGVPVPAEWWDHVKPKGGTWVSIVGLPSGLGGNFGRGGPSVVPADTLRQILSVLFLAGGAVVPGLLGLSGVAASAATVGISLAGVLATNALVPLPVTPEEVEAFTVTGTRNQAIPYAKIPRVFGRLRLFPMFGGLPQTEVVGNDQFLRLLFVLGYGPLQVSDLRIGSTPIGHFEGVEYEVFRGERLDPASPTLYTNDIHEETFDRTLEYAASWGRFVGSGLGATWEPEKGVVHLQTAQDIDEISVDLTFPNGLVRAVDGRNDPWNVQLHIQYREVRPRSFMSENSGWTDFVPDAADRIRNHLGEDGVTESTLQTWLEEAQTKLDDLMERLEYAFRYEESPIPAQFLQTLNDALSRAAQVFADTPADGARRERLDALRDRLNDILQIAGYMPLGTPTQMFDELLSELGQVGAVLAAIAEVNRILAEGYGGDDAAITNPLVRWWIYAQGLDAVFGTPPAGAFTLVDMRPGVVRFGFRWAAVPRGTYEVRIRRVSEPSTSDSIADECHVTCIRSIKKPDVVPPIRRDRIPPIGMVAMRIKASEQLSGVLDQFNCMVRAKLRSHDGTSWQEPTVAAGSNPAWAYADVIMDALAQKRYGKARTLLTTAEEAELTERLHLTSIRHWAEVCEANGYTVNVVVEQSITVLELIKRICALGRASYAVLDGQYGVVVDEPGKVPVALLTTRNTMGFSASRAFRELPHAMKLKYINPDAEWQQDEWIVYADGYAEIEDEANGIKQATRFEEQTLWGVVDSPNAKTSAGQDNPYRTGLCHKLGRFALAQGILRPETYEVTVDAEYLTFGRGDVVLLQTDVLEVGLGAGRIAQVTASGGTVTALVLDEPVYLEPGKDYALKVRRASGTVALVPITGTTEELIETVGCSFVQGSDPIQAGDLFTWGEEGREAIECLVKAIDPAADFGAKLTLVPYAPAVFDADTGPIPDFDPLITQPPVIRLHTPPAPVILGVVSDERVLVRNLDGSLDARIVLYLQTPPPSIAYEVRAVQVQFRPAGAPDTQWITVSTYSLNINQATVSPVQSGERYDVRVRFITAAGVAGDWALQLNHLVIGKTSPPPDVTTLVFEGDRLHWFYPNAPLDLAGFLVRFSSGVGATWENATPAHDGVLSASVFDFPTSGGGVQTWFIKAVDTSGNQSLKAAQVQRNLGDPLVSNVLFTRDYRAEGYPGTIRYGDVNDVTGLLEATSTAGLFWSRDGGRRFWKGDPDALFWANTYDPMTYEFEFTPSAEYLPAILKLDATVDATGYEILYLQDTGVMLWPELLSDPLWPASLEDDFWPAGAGYQAWPGEIQAEAQTYRFLIRTTGGPHQSTVPELKAILDVRDVTESVNDAEIVAGGSRLALKNTFRQIVSVTVALQQVPGYPDARTIEIIDKDPDLGPLIKVYDASHMSVDGRIDAHVKGY